MDALSIQIIKTLYCAQEINRFNEKINLPKNRTENLETWMMGITKKTLDK